MGIAWLDGRECTRIVEHYPNNFSFEFGPGILAVDTMWRIISGGKLVLTSQDHGHQFGLPAPVDAYACATSLLRDRKVTCARLREETADLLLEFEGGVVLEVLSNSAGYEPWHLTAPGISLVALGGGGISSFGTGVSTPPIS